MSRRKNVRRWMQGAALAAALASTVQSSSQADEWYPGLPDNLHITTFPDGFNGNGSWGASADGGMSYAKLAKQWFRSPTGMVTFVPGGSLGKQIDANTHSFGVIGSAIFVSPAGAPENYGYLPEMTVRSVGFGLTPIEATVQVSQRRRDGYPIPLVAKLEGTDYSGITPRGNYGKLRTVANPVVVDDAFNIQILKVKVDGVDLGLTGDCRTVTPAPVHMESAEYTIIDPDQPPHFPDIDVDYKHEWFRTHDPSQYFNPDYGGQLNGEITIPPFTGCTTKAGDDLSPLMTLSVSGPGNPVSGTAGFECVSPRGDGAPLAPGQSTPKLAAGFNCPGAQQIPYPARPAD